MVLYGESMDDNREGHTTFELSPERLSKGLITIRKFNQNLLVAYVCEDF